MMLQRNLNFMSLAKLMVTGLALFMMALAYQLYSQYQAFSAELQQDGNKFLSSFEQSIQQKGNQLEAIYALVRQSKSADTDGLLKSLSMNQTESSFFALGKASEVLPDNWTHFVEKMKQIGFESFHENQFNTATSAPIKPDTKRVIIHKSYPYTPEVVRLLGKNLANLPGFDLKIKQMQAHNQAQPLIALLNNKPMLILFWGMPAQKFEANPLQTPQNFLYSMYDLNMALTNAIENSFKNHTLNATLYLLPAEWQGITPQIPLIENSRFAPFLLNQDFNLAPLGLPLKLSLTFTMDWQDFKWYDALIWSLLFTLFLTAVASLLFASSQYTQHLKTQKKRLKEFLQNAHEAIILTDHNGEVIYWNPMALKIFGYRHTEAIGRNLKDLIIAEPSDPALKTPQLYAEKSQKIHSELLKRDGQLIECEISISQLGIADAKEIAFFIEDVTQRNFHEQEIKRLAFYDSLTGLENRSFFSSKVEEILNSPAPKPAALLFIDLDGFKKVNDSLGHSIGDQLLKVVALRFQNATRANHKNTHLCRFGGDEFVFYLDDISPEGAEQNSLRILKQLEKVIKIEPHEIQISCSIGIALYPEHGKDLDNLLRHADSAMYQSKFNGKNTFSIYEPKMDEKLSQHLLIEKHLRRALAQDEFELFYQPQIDSKTLQIIGVEALLRWNSHEIGFVPPDIFIPVSEDSGQILAIGDWVIRAAIKQLVAWRDTPLQGLRIAINISAQQLEQSDFATKLSNALLAANIPSHLLEIELTERSVMSNAQGNIELFKDIRAKGLSLSVDDFGTGYSSLSYLKRFPLNILKVDKSFVDGLPGDDDDISISTSIIQLAHSLKMKVVAEGVETLAQFEFLREHECDMVQGYLFSKPLNIAGLEAWYAEHHNGFKLKPPTE